MRVQHSPKASDLSEDGLNVDSSVFHVAWVSFLPLIRIAQDSNICSRNFTDTVERERYLPSKSVEKDLSSLDTLEFPSRDHIW